MEINGLGGIPGIGASSPLLGKSNDARPAAAENKKGNFLGELVTKVNELQVNADRTIQEFASGEAKGLHEVMIAMEKSSVSFQFLNQVRNKAMEAYQEIMRMQV